MAGGGQLWHHLPSPSWCGDSTFGGQCHQGRWVLEEKAGVTSTGLVGKQLLAKSYGPVWVQITGMLRSPSTSSPRALGQAPAWWTQGCGSLDNATAPGQPLGPGHGSVPVQSGAMPGCRWSVLGSQRTPHSPHTAPRHLGLVGTQGLCPELHSGGLGACSNSSQSDRGSNPASLCSLCRRL